MDDILVWRNGGLRLIVTDAIVDKTLIDQSYQVNMMPARISE
jgi:hypothetical protein